jgi:hypothetical protein
VCEEGDVPLGENKGRRDLGGYSAQLKLDTHRRRAAACCRSPLEPSGHPVEASRHPMDVWEGHLSWDLREDAAGQGDDVVLNTSPRV